MWYIKYSIIFWDDANEDEKYKKEKRKASGVVYATDYADAVSQLSAFYREDHIESFKIAYSEIEGPVYEFANSKAHDENSDRDGWVPF